MEQAEFDKFAAEYEALHAQNIAISGEPPEYFAEYKAIDVARYLSAAGVNARRLLDFGAGVGGSIPHFRRHLPDARVTCVDVSQSSLDIGAGRFKGDAEFKHFDGATIPFPDGAFDVAFAACVFHHIDAAEHVPLFAEIGRVLRPGGFLFVFEHNPIDPLTVRAVNMCPFDENAVLIRRHTLRKRIGEAGLRVARADFRIFFPRPLRSLRWLESWLTWCPLGAQYVVVARKC